VFDVASALYDVCQFIKDPSLTNLGLLGFDIGTLLSKIIPEPHFG
jgi:hypothetical protein